MTNPALRDLFDNPPRDFSPTPLWWWSGARVDSERLRFQMQRFCEGGIFNLVIINLAPAGPIVGGRADDPAWFSDQWWARFIETCEIAEELGMRIWFYDQIGFSGANVQGTVTHDHPEAAGHALRSHRVTVESSRIRLPAAERVLALYDGIGRRMPDPAADGTLAVAPADGTLADGTELLLVTTAATAFDYLDPAAVRLLMASIHSRFDERVPQYLGNVIAGSFQDELPSTNSWTPQFAEEFLARRGYDLLEHLPSLWNQGSAADAKVRGDYFAVRAELTEEALFRPLGTWHSDRGMLVGSDQTNPARAGNPTQATQLYTDYFRTHRWYSAAGSDHEGDAKVHSSMAHLYGHERVWIESFHSSGWGGTLEDTYDWLIPFLRSGANLYNPHASYFGTAGGWFEWAPPSTDWRQPYYRHYADFSRAVSRIASIMSWGSFEADVALLYPTSTAQALLTLDTWVDHFGDGQVGSPYEDLDETQRLFLELSGANNWFETKPGALDSAGIAFDVIDDDSIQRSAILTPPATRGALGIRDLNFSTVILPATSVLEAPTAKRLTELLDAGGTVIAVGRMPATAAGRDGDDDVVRALARHPLLEVVSTAAEAVALVARSPQYASSDVPILVRRQGADAVALVSGAFPNASSYPLRHGHWLWDDYDFDRTRYAAIKIVEVRAEVARAQVWNPATGAMTDARVRTRDGISAILVDLAGAPAVIVTWSEGSPEAAAVAAPIPAVKPLDISDGWSGSLVATMDNRFGDFALPAGADTDALQVWTVDWTEGEQSQATEVKVTSGLSALVLDSVDAATAPAPLTPDEVTQIREGARPLGAEGWRASVYSASRGEPRQGETSLGNKGLVPEEFVRVLSPEAGSVAAVRVLLDTPFRGEFDLVVGAGAAKSVWFDGIELAGTGGYALLSRVEVTADVSVLEYRLAASDNPPTTNLSGSPVTLGSFFALFPIGGWGQRPEFMWAVDSVAPNGRVTYTRSFTVPADAVCAGLTVGAATGLSVSIDGTVVARQEKVEYYESSWGATPMYFSHDVTALLGAGDHSIDVVADSADPRDVVFVDLVVQHANGVDCVTSGPGWVTSSGSTAAVSAEFTGHWAELISSHVVTRSHPLPEVEWMHGAPVIGSAALAVASGVDVQPASQRFGVELPAGTVAVTIPLRVDARASIGGVSHDIVDGGIRLEAPLAQPVRLEVETDAVAFRRGGAAWAGPLVVETRESPIRLEPWQQIGLRSWSGGVRYRRTVDLPSPSRVWLDLGDLRGSVDVSVDGEPVGSAFCAPFRFDLGEREGPIEIGISVFNTLGPFFDESTPTRWVFPSQLVSGLMGPVTLTLS